MAIDGGLVARLILLHGDPWPLFGVCGGQPTAESEMANKIGVELALAGGAVIDGNCRWWLTAAGVRHLPATVEVGDVPVGASWSEVVANQAEPVNGRPTCRTCGHYGDGGAVPDACTVARPRVRLDGQRVVLRMCPWEFCGEHTRLPAWRAARVARLGEAVAFLPWPARRLNVFDGREPYLHISGGNLLNGDAVQGDLALGLGVLVYPKLRPMNAEEVAAMEAGGAVTMTPADVVDPIKTPRVLWLDAWGVLRCSPWAEEGTAAP